MQQQLSNHCVILLLTSCKTCVRYPQCTFAANNRTMLLKQMRRSVDHVQELLLRQYTANFGVCTIPSNNIPFISNSTNLLTLPSTTDFQQSKNFFPPQQPATTIYRSIPNEQIYFPYLDTLNQFKPPFHFPFFTYSNFNEQYNNYPSNELNFLNHQTARAPGTLITNENCKLININRFNWLNNLLLLPSANNQLSPKYKPFANGAKQLNFNVNFNASHLNLPSSTHLNHNHYYDSYFDKFRLEKANYLNPQSCYLNSVKFSPSYQSPKQRENARDNLSRLSTNYSVITNDDSSLLTDSSRSMIENFYSPCLPLYASDLNNSPNNYLPLSNFNGQQQQQTMQQYTQFIHSQNLLHHYLLCQLQTLEKQQHQYYDNVFTSAFYNNDDEIESNTTSNKTDQCLTIHNLLCCFEVKCFWTSFFELKNLNKNYSFFIQTNV